MYPPVNGIISSKKNKINRFNSQKKMFPIICGVLAT